MKLAKSLFIVLSLLSGASANAQQATDGSLYTALGGKPGITVIVDTMLNNIADDMRIVHFFANVNIAHVRHGLITQFCDISGGPCHYRGLNMSDAHRGLRITPAAFNALVEDLRAAMTGLHIPIGTQNRLLAKFVPMRNRIVEPP